MSHKSDAFDHDLIAFENALGSLAAGRSRLDRDRLMFQAGQASALNRPSPWGLTLWKTAASSFALIAFGEAMFLASRPANPPVERVVVVVREPAPAPAPETVVPPVSPLPTGRLSLPLGTTPSERLTAQLLRYGLDGLPAPLSGRDPSLSDGPVPSSRQWLQTELHKLLEPGGPS